MAPLFRALAERRLQALEAHLPSARGGDVVGVHQARVASRRLREIIPVLGARGSPRRRRRARRAMRRLTRALGGVRELDVTLALLDALASRYPDLAPAAVALRVDVQATRAAQQDELDAALSSKLPGKAVRRIAAWLAHDLPVAPAAEALASRIASRAAGLRRAIEDVGLLFDDERLHQVRIATKKLRYALEVAGETRWARTALLVKQLKGVQDALGELHDRHVLVGMAAPWQSGAVSPGSAGDQAVREAMERLVTRLEQERRALHARYLRRRPALIAATDAARDRVAARVLERGVPATEASSRTTDGV
jgi:CHAD domain-containing protein